MTRLADLAASLARYTPADETEAGHLARMLALAGSPDDPCARDHFVPGHFTASAFVLDAEGTSVLLIFHEKFRRWLQPGGHVDPEDGDLVAAALREVQEETGLSEVDVVGEGWFDLDIHDIPARKGDPAHQHFDVRILLRARTGQADAQRPMDDWLGHTSLWVRRVAMLHQLGWKVQTDQARLFRYALALAPETDFFIRKAIGWALRDHARTQPEAVRTFLADHAHVLSGLTRREAGKHLG